MTKLFYSILLLATLAGCGSSTVPNYSTLATNSATGINGTWKSSTPMTEADGGTSVISLVMNANQISYTLTCNSGSTVTSQTSTAMTSTDSTIDIASTVTGNQAVTSSGDSCVAELDQGLIQYTLSGNQLTLTINNNGQDSVLNLTRQ